MTVHVTFQETPNPQSMKFLFSQKISEESIHFEDPLKAERSPLASKIFGFPWASAVYIGLDFVTITKQEWVEWDVISEPLANLLREHVEGDLPVLVAQATQVEDENDSPTVKQIKEILNTEIRPAVAMDGGDIIFHKYEDGIVYLFMQGACAGCPSSALTLKDGIETRLKESVPEIVEVVSV